MKQYKSTKKFKCPYCNKQETREKLVYHIENNHEELLPQNYTAAQVVYELINKKNYGICMICKSKVTEWDERLWKYKNLCKNPKCREEVRRIALDRHMKIYNKPTLLGDAEHQEKMLANRKISGTYKFSDGGERSYTGQYEKKALEFLDTVMNISSEDIQSPGPILTYEYNEKTHFWITDIYYIPANLIIEIKDGGSNPNTRSMESYRDKQVAKEIMITNLGTYNYLRLTNNDFSQLLLVLAELKLEMMNDKDYNYPTGKIHINEEVGGMPPNRPPESYIIPYGFKGMNDNDVEGFAFGNSMLDKIFAVDDDQKIKLMNEDFLEDRKFSLYKVNKLPEDFYKKLIDLSKKDKTDNKNAIINLILDKPLLSESDIDFLPELSKIIIKEDLTVSILESTAKALQNEPTHDIPIYITDYTKHSHVGISKSPDGYYAHTGNAYYLQSKYYAAITDIPQDILKILDDMWKSHFNLKD